MQKLSQEEYNKRFGSQAPFAQAPKKSFFQGVGSTIKNSFNAGLEQGRQGVAQINNTSGNPLNLVEGVGKVGAGFIQSAFSPLSPITEPTIGKGMNYASDKISNSPAVQKFANTKVGQFTSRAAEDVANYANIAGTVGGAMEAPKVAGAIKTKVANSAEAFGSKIDSAVNTVKETVSPTVDPTAQFLKDATPNYSKKLVGERPIKNPDGTVTPRVREGGLIKGRTVTPTALEQDAASELAKVPNYPLNGTALEKFQALQPEIESRGQSLKVGLQNEKILRPPQQIQKVISNAVNKVPEESLLLQKSDPVIVNYMRVAKNAIAQSDGTLAGELEVRIKLDQAYKNARGKMAFGSDKLSALDDIHTAARDALNQDIISKARNVDVKASLKAQWDLMRASDVLRNKAETESGTIIGRFIQENPVTSKVIKGAGRAAGIGLGVDLFH